METAREHPTPLANLLSRLTWLVLAVVLVILVGGTHPSARMIDTVIIAAAVVIALLNVPITLWLVRHRDRLTTAAWKVVLVGLAVRVGLAALALDCLGGTTLLCPVKGEFRPGHEVHRSCSAVIAAGPGGTPDCEMLHMCANEAQLEAEESKRLMELIAATPGCPAP